MGFASTLFRVILPQAADTETLQAYELLEKARSAESIAAAAPHLRAFKELVDGSLQKNIYDLDGIQEILAEHIERAIERNPPRRAHLQRLSTEEVLPFLLVAEGEGCKDLLEKAQVYWHLQRRTFEGALINIALATITQRGNPAFDVERAWSDWSNYNGVRKQAINEGAWRGDPHIILSIDGSEPKMCFPTELVYDATRRSIVASIDQSLQNVPPEEIASQRYSHWFNRRITQLQTAAEQLLYSDSNLEEMVEHLKARKEKIVEEAKPQIRELVGEAYNAFMAAEGEDIGKAYTHLGTLVGKYQEVFGIEDYTQSMKEYFRRKVTAEQAKDEVFGGLVWEAKQTTERLHDEAFEIVFGDDRVSRGQWERAYTKLMRLSDDYGEELEIDNLRVYAQATRERRDALFPQEKTIQHRIS